jgi:zinc protease
MSTMASRVVGVRATVRAWLAVAVVLALVAGCRPVILKDGQRAAGGAAATVGDLAGAPPIGAPAADFQIPPVSERVLANGLTVLAAEYRALPLVEFVLLFPGGAAYDPPGKGGVAELTAALLRQGTATRSAEELAREIESLGGDLDADAGMDFASVSGEFLSKDLDQALDLLVDVTLHPAFRPDEFRRAQGLALAGIVAARESPSAVADRCYQAFLYGAHPYGHPSGGTEETVPDLTVADVRSFYERHYGPDHAVLVLVGNAPAAELLDRAERAFGGWRAIGDERVTLPEPARVPSRRILLVDKPDANQAHIRIGNIAIARTDPRYVVGGVTSTILGGGFGARLIEELRVKRSLTYGAWSVFVARRVPGDFRVGTFTKVETTGQALDVALEVLRGFDAGGPTPVELARAESLLTGQYPKSLETPGALAGRLAELQAYGLPRSDLETYPQRVLAVGVAEVKALAEAYVPVDDGVIVVVGPGSTLAGELARFGPIERTTPEGCDVLGGPAAR